MPYRSRTRRVCRLFRWQPQRGYTCLTFVWGIIKDGSNFFHVIHANGWVSFTHNSVKGRNRAKSEIDKMRWILPTKQKRSMCISHYMQTTFFYLWRFLKKLADNQCSSLVWLTTGTIYHIKHNVYTTFYHESGLTCIWMVMEGSIMFDICTYCVFTLYRRTGSN